MLLLNTQQRWFKLRAYLFGLEFDPYQYLIGSLENNYSGSRFAIRIGKSRATKVLKG